MPVEWVCPKCTISVVPFSKYNLSAVDIYDVAQSDNDYYAYNVIMRIMHLNAQSMTSSFDELVMTIKQYPFDIITMSKTWLKDNKYLLDYVSIPGYVNVFRNRDRIRGGGVGIYIRDSINFKRRQDIEKLNPDMEHLWLEIPGLNKNSVSTENVINNGLVYVWLNISNMIQMLI